MLATPGNAVAPSPATRTAKMPASGLRRLPSATLAVGKPSVRPSRRPPTTRPAMVYGRPSRVAARSSSPAASAARIAVLDTLSPATITLATCSTPKPLCRPAASRSPNVPARPRAKRKSSPTTRCRTRRRATSSSSMKACGSSPAIARSNGGQNMQSMPVRRIAWYFSRQRVNRAGGLPGLISSCGVGSKVKATAMIPCCRAAAMTRAKMRWCPRCTPSKTPMVATHPDDSAGSACRGRRIRSMGPCRMKKGEIIRCGSGAGGANRPAGHPPPATPPHRPAPRRRRRPPATARAAPRGPPASARAEECPTAGPPP